MPFSIGENVGPYRILEQLGQGGMATVYKAYHASLDRYVAIKVLHPAFREDPTFLARFTREARVVAKLEHPHIVPIYDFAEQDGQPYLVMKYIEGETLKARLARNPLSAEEAMRVVEAVGAALSFAHSRGILHRDIKPSNVLITPDGGIFLADFGLARIAQSGESTLSSDMLLGTPHYISPEQAQGLKNLDEGTDIYSLGVVLYELAVGRVPFNADTPFSIIHDHIYTPLPLPGTINPKVPRQVERVLLKALAKERKDRYASVEMLVRAFITAVRGAAAEAQPAAPREASAAINAKTPPPRAPPVPQPAPPKAKTGEPFWKRLPRWFVIAVPIFLCICLCLIGFLIIRSREKDQTPTETSAIQQPVEPVGGVTPVAPVEPIGNATPDIPLDAREAWLHLNKGLDLMGSGDKSAGIKEFQTALDLIPTERTEVILLAVQRLADSGNWMMAGEFIRKGLQADAHNPALRLAASEVLFRLSADREGVSLLRMMAEQNPDWSTALATYARWLYTFSSNPQDAGSVLQKAKDVAEDDELFLVRTVDGEYLCINGNKGEGLGTLGSVNDNPNTPPWLRVETERMIKKWQ